MNKTYGVLVPDTGLDSKPNKKENGKIEDNYDIFSFPAAWFILPKCKGLEAGSGFRLVDVYRDELQAKQIREAIYIKNEYDYMDKLREMEIMDPPYWEKKRN